MSMLRLRRHASSGYCILGVKCQRATLIHPFIEDRLSFGVTIRRADLSSVTRVEQWR
jgi:hypothetical protein